MCLEYLYYYYYIILYSSNRTLIKKKNSWLYFVGPVSNGGCVFFFYSTSANSFKTSVYSNIQNKDVAKVFLMLLEFFVLFLPTLTRLHSVCQNTR